MGEPCGTYSGLREMHTQLEQENLKERVHFEDLDVECKMLK